MGKAWWKGGLGGGNLADMEEVIFPDVEGDGKVPADGVGGGGPPTDPGGGQPPGWGGPLESGQPTDGVGNLEEADEEGVDLSMPELLEDDDDEDEEGEENMGGEEPPIVRTSSRGNRGVPPTRYYDVFELASDITSPPTIAMALGGDKGVGCCHEGGAGVPMGKWSVRGGATTLGEGDWHKMGNEGEN